MSESENNELIKTNVSKYICGFKFALVGKKEERDGVEKYFYDNYNPECNEVSPPDVNPFEVNLP